MSGFFNANARFPACSREAFVWFTKFIWNANRFAHQRGHPLGMSGTRIVQAATNELIRTVGRYALATMCVGVGMGYAIIIENTTI